MSAESTFEIDVASGAALDALGQMAGAGLRLPDEPDASYRQHVRDALRRRAEASPDAFRRAADEVSDLLRRGAEHREDIRRLNESLRDRADKIHEVRLELRRAGFPVNEGAWPTEQLRALVDAYLAAHPARAVVVESLDLLSAAGLRSGDLRDRLRALIADRAALLAADDPMIAELIAILGGACLPSEIVGRARELSRRRDLLEVECGNLRDAHGELTAQRSDLSRRLEAVTLDRVGLLAKLEALRGERDKARDDANASFRHHSAALDVIRGLNSKIATLTGERDAARATSCKLDDERANLARRLEVAEDERDALRAPKVAAVEWDGAYLHVDGSQVSWVDRPRIDRWRVGGPAGKTLGFATSGESARKLAELLANHDPGGVWRVNGDVVSPDTVRLVCPSVAVTWGES